MCNRLLISDFFSTLQVISVSADKGKGLWNYKSSLCCWTTSSITVLFKGRCAKECLGWTTEVTTNRSNGTDKKSGNIGIMDTLLDTMLHFFFFFQSHFKTSWKKCKIFLVRGVTGVVWSFYYFGSSVNVRWRVDGDKQMALLLEIFCCIFYSSKRSWTLEIGTPIWYWWTCSA